MWTALRLDRDPVASVDRPSVLAHLTSLLVSRSQPLPPFDFHWLVSPPTEVKTGRGPRQRKSKGEGLAARDYVAASMLSTSKATRTHRFHQSRDIENKVKVSFSKCSVGARYPDRIAIHSGLVWTGPRLSSVFLCAQANNVTLYHVLRVKYRVTQLMAWFCWGTQIGARVLLGDSPSPQDDDTVEAGLH